MYGEPSFNQVFMLSDINCGLWWDFSWNYKYLGNQRKVCTYFTLMATKVPIPIFHDCFCLVLTQIPSFAYIVSRKIQFNFQDFHKIWFLGCLSHSSNNRRVYTFIAPLDTWLCGTDKLAVTFITVWIALWRSMANIIGQQKSFSEIQDLLGKNQCNYNEISFLRWCKFLWKRG